MTHSLDLGNARVSLMDTLARRSFEPGFPLALGMTEGGSSSSAREGTGVGSCFSVFNEIFSYGAGGGAARYKIKCFSSGGETP